MNKQEFLSASLPYRLKCLYIGSDGIRQLKNNILMDDYSYPTQLIGIIGYCHYFKDIGNDIELIEENKFKPIVRHISDLTKECIQKDYKDGRPFIPIKELYNLFGYDIPMWQNNLIAPLTIEPFYCVLQLIKWHFWINIPEGEEVVYITNEFNPYK